MWVRSVEALAANGPSEELHYAELDQLPAIGHKVATASDGQWHVGQVRDRRHRVVDGQGAADVAVSLKSISAGQFSGEPLPSQQLDGLGQPAAKPTSAVPRAGPWAR